MNNESDDYDVVALKKLMASTPVGQSFCYPRRYQIRVHSVAVRQNMTVETRLLDGSVNEITVRRTS